jgi:hypothetical protein
MMELLNAEMNFYMTDKMSTPEKRKVMCEIRDEWINMFFDNVKEGRGIDKAAFERGIRWLYCSFMKMNMPEIVYFDSWEEATNRRMMYNKKYSSEETVNTPYCKKQHLFEKKLNRMEWPYDEQTDCNAIIEEGVTGKLIANILFRLENWIIKRMLPPEIDKETMVSNFSKSYDMRNFCRNHSVYEWGVMAKYDYNLRTGYLNPSPFLRQSMSLAKACAFVTSTYPDCVLAVQPPVHISLNALGSLHSLEGPAIQLRDGISFYCINGRRVPEWIFEEKDSITREKFLNEKNAETRAAIYAVRGHKKMMEMLGTETVHTSEITHANGDVETVELLKTRDRFPEIENQPFAWVKVTCPSTGTNYLLGVEPKYKNAAEALASLSMFRSEEYSFNFRT